MLIGRRTRTLLPIHQSQIRTANNKQSVKRALKKKQKVQKAYYDRNTKPLVNLKPGQQIRVRTDKTWQPGVVESKSQEPRSYIVKTESGQQLRRNRRHILKTNEDRRTDNNTEDYIEITDQEIQSQNEENRNVENENIQVNKTSSGRVVKLPKKFEDYDMK